MNERPPSDNAERIVVRLPDGMRDRLSQVAKLNRRSVNAEVVSRLSESLMGDPFRQSPSNLPLSVEGVKAAIRSLQALADDPDLLDRFFEDRGAVRREVPEDKR